MGGKDQSAQDLRRALAERLQYPNLSSILLGGLFGHLGVSICLYIRCLVLALREDAEHP